MVLQITIKKRIYNNERMLQERLPTNNR